MEDILVLVPMIGGMLIAVVAVIFDAKQKNAVIAEQQSVTKILSNDNMSLEDIVKSVLKMQLDHQKKDKRMERIIGFLMGIASSLIVSVVLYLIGMS